MAEDGFEAYWLGSTRAIPDKGDLRDYWTEISSDRDFLGPDPSYIYIRDHETANVPYLLAQYLFRHAEERKNGARMFGGHFIRRLADHFGLVSDEGLMGFFVITHMLLVFDLHELAKLNIRVRLGDTCAWVAPGLERQQVAAAGAPKVVEALFISFRDGTHRQWTWVHLTCHPHPWYIFHPSPTHHPPMGTLSSMPMPMPVVMEFESEQSNTTAKLPILKLGEYEM
ncbi:hypothetical protein Tco_0917323 [Tanacetum coccineum]